MNSKISVVISGTYFGVSSITVIYKSGRHHTFDCFAEVPDSVRNFIDSAPNREFYKDINSSEIHYSFD